MAVPAGAAKTHSAREPAGVSVPANAASPAKRPLSEPEGGHVCETVSVPGLVLSGNQELFAPPGAGPQAVIVYVAAGAEAGSTKAAAPASATTMIPERITHLLAMTGAARRAAQSSADPARRGGSILVGAGARARIGRVDDRAHDPGHRRRRGALRPGSDRAGRPRRPLGARDVGSPAA